MKTSDLVVRALEAEGVERVFGVPGEETLDLLESLRRSSIEFVLTRHEQAAGFMAATWGRLSGCPGVCLATLGPGATNLVTAAAYAQLGAMPMVMITGQKPVKSSKQGYFQIVDVVDMMQPLTKYAVRLGSGEVVPARVREAFRLAQEERPGAVHLELPEDIARDDAHAPVLEAAYTRRPTADDKAVEAAIEAIEDARRPLLLVGAGANRKRTSRTLGGFVEHTGIPFFTTQMGKGVVDERNPLCLGTAATSSRDFVHVAIERADVIVNVGHDVVEKPPFVMEHGGQRVIHVNFSSATVDPVYFPQLEVVGDIANSLWRIGAGIARQAHWEFAPFLEVKRAIDEHAAQRSSDASFPLVPERIVADLRRVLPSNGVLALDNGIYKIWFSRYYPAHLPNTLLLDNALASMGAGLPSAMAASFLSGAPAVAVCGDGGFMMNSQEMETAVRYGLDLVVVVLRDDAYGMIRWKQAVMGLPDWGLRYGNPDFPAYAEAYGASGHRVHAAGELAPLVERCLAAGGVHLIEVPVDYSANERILDRELPELSASLAARLGT